MLSPRHLLAVTFTVALSLCSPTLYGSPATSERASRQAVQQSVQPLDEEREQTIKLYQTGDAAGAVKRLQAFVKREKNDIRAWHYLGLALASQGNPKDARKAHEKAARLADKLITDKLEGMDALKEIYGRISPFKAQLIEAADSADKYVELSENPSKSKVSEWRTRADFLRDFAELTDELKDANVFSPNDVTTKARILSKPSPEYTEAARQNQVTGTVMLVMIFSADGKIRGLIPIARLPYGLTESAMKAARNIKFSPAIKNGKPVSQFIRVEYNFNIY